MDGTSRPLLALLLVSLSGSACSFTTTPEAKSVQLPKPPAGTAQADQQDRNLDVQFAKARTLEQDGDLDRASSLYRTILSQNPRHAGAVHRLAIVCDRQGRHEEAHSLFRRALALRPGNADLLCDAGYSYYCRQQWLQAERHLRFALDADPHHERAHRHLGLTLAAQGKDGVALRELAKSGCSTAEAHLNLAQMQTFTGRLEEAELNCELARKADPKSKQIGTQLQQVETLLAQAQSAKSASPAEEVIVAQKTPEPRESPIWRVGFETKAAAEPQPTPAATLNTAAENTRSTPAPQQAETSDAQTETSKEPAEASAKSDESRLRRLFRWRRADKSESK